MTTTEVVAGTARLACDVDGAGETVVLVHAGIADARMWDPLVARLVDRWRVVRYDLRGYGRSALPPRPFDHADHRDAGCRRQRRPQRRQLRAGAAPSPAR